MSSSNMNVFESDSAVSVQEVSKRKRVYKNSVGNDAKFPQQTKKQKADDEIKSISQEKCISNEEVNRKIVEFASCGCSRGIGHGGCFVKCFNGDFNAAIYCFKACREITRQKTEIELDSFIQELFRSSIVDQSICKNGDVRFQMEYKLHTIASLSKFKSIIVCKKVFTTLYDISTKFIERCSKAIKVSDSLRVSSISMRSYRDDTLHDLNYAQVKQIFDQNVLHSSDGSDHNAIVEPRMIRCSIMPLADLQQYASIWLDNYFTTYGDQSPNSDETKLLVMQQKDVYDKYKREMEAANPPRQVVSNSRFNELWRVLFPTCRSRPWCDVPGKCSTCFEIDKQRHSEHDSVIQEHLKMAHTLHRGGLFMLERNEYKKRCNRAIENQSLPKPTILSMIIDGMDQTHCKIPYNGTQSCFSNPLKQCLTGIKEHGQGLTIYRTIDTIRKGSDLSIYCVLSQIESWKERQGYYPEEIYLQVDGGSENANQYLLATLELLVVKKISRIIYYTRLPTGHTHEDIDACFALIWVCFRSQPCLTFQGYKKLIEEKLGHSALRAKVKDVYVIPNYQDFFERCIDSKLGRLHHEESTQHQWRFEAVDSINFPDGCKTTYKAYSSDNVVELILKPKGQCLSAVGQYTGLEPVSVYCPWQPAASGLFSDPRRQGIEGFYILRNIPHNPNRTIDPCPFPDNAKEEINKCLREVRSSQNDEEVKTLWAEWANVYAPLSNDSMEYINQLKTFGILYHVPLKAIFTNKNIRLQNLWNRDLKPSIISQPGFELPEILAVATNSVVSEFNPNAPDPRIYSINDVDLANALLEYSNRTIEYYTVFLSNSTVAKLAQLIKRQISFNGEVPSITGRKNGLVKKINQFDIFFNTTIIRRLSSANQRFVELNMNILLFTVDTAEEVIARIGNFNVSRNIIKEFSQLSTGLTAKSMRVILELFRCRDKRICDSHYDANHEKNNYEVFQPSLFFSPNVLRALNSYELSEILDIELLFRSIIPANLELINAHRIYLLYNGFDEDGIERSNLEESVSWCLLVVEIFMKKIYFIDPTGIRIEPNSPLFQRILVILRPLLSKIIGEEGAPIVWNINHFPLYLANWTIDNNHRDSGICVALSLYFMVVNCPIHFDTQNIKSFRESFTYWILGEKLPI